MFGEVAILRALTFVGLPMTRSRAALIHLAISLTVGSAVLAVLWLVFYPPPFFGAAGANELIAVLMGVDVVMGPMLTLLVFRTGKPSLRFDLTVIALLQAGAMAYGLSVAFQARPIFLVGAVDRFVLVASNQIYDKDLAQGSSPAFRGRSWHGPRLAVAMMPQDPKERSNVVIQAVTTGRDIEVLPKYYHPYNEAGKTLLARARPLSTLDKEHPELARKAQKWLREQGRDPKQIVWLPVTVRRGELVALLDADTAKLLHMVFRG